MLGQLPTRWNLTRTTVYPANCKAPCTPGALVIPNLTLANYAVDLTAPGTDYYLRQNQFDWGLRKLFKVRQYQFSAQMDLFNALNRNPIITYNNSFTPNGPWLQPNAILTGRGVRFSAEWNF